MANNLSPRSRQLPAPCLCRKFADIPTDTSQDPALQLLGSANQGRIRKVMKSFKPIFWSLFGLLVVVAPARAGEADLAIPNLWENGRFDSLGGITPGALLFWGSFLILGSF